MSNTTKPRVYGRMVDFTASAASTGATALSTWEDFNIDFEGKEYAARAASSPVYQGDVFPEKLTGSANGFVGEGESLPELPQVGDTLLTIAPMTITEGADLMGDISQYGAIKVTKTNYKQNVEAGKWGFSFASTGFPAPAS